MNSKLKKQKQIQVEIKLDKTCFQHDMAYEDFNDLARRTAYDKVLNDEIFNIAKNSKYDEYQRGLASMVYNLFHKKSSDIGSESAIKQNEYE